MAKGDGTIIKKGRGTYEVQVSFGKNPITKKYERATRTVHGTMADARRVRDELRAQHDGGLSIDGHRLTFGEFATQWLERKSLDELAETTIHDYRRIIEACTQVMGEMKLCDVRAKDVDDFYCTLRKERGMSESRLGKYHAVLHALFEDAARLELIAKNPVDNVKAPKKAAAKRRSLSPGESHMLESILERDTAAAIQKSAGYSPSERAFALLRISRFWAVRLALATGMRRGELLALEWGDVDPAHDVIHVRRSLNEYGNYKLPKSDAGIRTVGLYSGTAKALAAWKSTQAEMLADICMEQTDETPVCCSSTGTEIPLSNFSRWWRKYRAEIGFDGLKLHELRHSQASQLLALGVDVKTVQHRLGHSNSSVTLDVYAHALPENDRRAAEMLGKILESGDNDSNVIQLKSA